MTIVSTLPAFVLALIQPCRDELLTWFSTQVYDDLIARDSDHLLVKLTQRLDFGELEAACARFHHIDGFGAPPTYSVPQMVRILLVMDLFNWSTRTMEWHLRYNVMIRWFVGCPLGNPGPDHTTINRFVLWVCLNQHDVLFNDTLRQIDETLPGEREAALRLQIGDTYALEANAAKETRVRMLRHACELLLTVLEKQAPAMHVRVQGRVDAQALFGAPNEKDEYFLSDARRAERLQTTVRAALMCVRLVQADLTEHPGHSPEVLAAITHWIEVVCKIIQGEVDLQPSALTAKPPTTPIEAPATPIEAPTTPIEAPAASAPLAETLTTAPASPATEMMPNAPPTEVLAPAAPTTTDSASSPANEMTLAVPSADSPAPATVPAASPANDPSRANSTTPATTLVLSDDDLALLAVVALRVHVKGAYRYGSVTDLDATYRLHAGKPAILGYNVSVRISPNGFIRAIDAETGAINDGTSLAARLGAEQQHGGCVPRQLAFDSAAGLGKIRHEVVVATHGYTQIVAPLHGAGRRTSEFGPEDFALSSDGRSLTCPNQRVSIIAFRSSSGDGRTFRFQGKQCLGCPLRAKCRDPKQSPDSVRMRQVFISDYRADVDEARAFNETAEYKTIMKNRPTVEREIANLVRYNGGRRATRRGLLKADFQAKGNAMSVNLKKWMRELDRLERGAKKPVAA